MADGCKPNWLSLKHVKLIFVLFYFKELQLKATCNQHLTVYIDGKMQIATNAANWSLIDVFDLSSDARIIGLECIDEGMYLFSAVYAMFKVIKCKFLWQPILVSITKVLLSYIMYWYLKELFWAKPQSLYTFGAVFKVK